jgi:uncharacterized membrane protein
MPTPLHPAIVHLPLVLAFLIPILAVVVAFLSKSRKWPASTWILVMVLQLGLTVSGYIALETGETDEVAVGKVVAKEYINEHEEAAEIFVGLTVLATVFSIAVYFLKQEVQFPLQMIVALIGVFAAYQAFRTGQMGGEIAYYHGGAAAHLKDHLPANRFLPTPDSLKAKPLDTSSTNESLQPDDNDYGNGDSTSESDDEGSKVED